MDADDETNLTEIEILRDGRICIFGMSEAVLAAVHSLRTLEGDRLASRLEALKRCEEPPALAIPLRSQKVSPPSHHSSEDGRQR